MISPEHLRRDGAIAALAAERHGIVSRAELRAIGLSAKAIDYRVGTKRLHRVHPGVYSLGRPPVHPYERAMAAVVACGDGALLAGLAAAALWEQTAGFPDRLAVITAHHRRPRGLTVHRVGTLTDADRSVHWGIPVTSPARTLLDCALLLSPRALRRAVNAALHTAHLKRSHLEEICRLHPAHRGAGRLLPFYDTRDGATRSAWEDDFPDWSVRHGLPRPVMDLMIDGTEVDAYYVAEQLVVELDGWGSHAGRDQFESDRDRDAERLLIGIPTVRVTRYRISEQESREAERLRGILARRRVEIAAYEAFVSQAAA